MVRRVPLQGDEKESLLASLDRHRDVVLWKLEGLDEEQARRPMTPTGTSLLGLVKHLAGVEYQWFCHTFGVLREELEMDPVKDMTPGADETMAAIVSFYRRARAASDEVVAGLDVEATGTAWFGEQVSLRRVLVGMVEETARHAGHMDIIREMLDGTVGAHAPD
jgi:uncharacterized damage-inducible protein DinB